MKMTTVKTYATYNDDAEQKVHLHEHTDNSNELNIDSYYV